MGREAVGGVVQIVAAVPPFAVAEMHFVAVAVADAVAVAAVAVAVAVAVAEAAAGGFNDLSPKTQKILPQKIAFSSPSPPA